MSLKANYIKAVVICHGKSEVSLTRYISTNLRLTIKKFGKDNGKHSIQITSLMNCLNAKPFNTLTNFKAEYVVETNKNQLNNFKLFIIMDTDDCTEEQRKAFINKEMFKEHWLYDYIVPIYNTPNLEEVLIKCGVIKRKPKNSEKADLYERIFPINKKPLSNDTLLEIKTLRKKIKDCPDTNIEKYIDYCLSLLP